MADTETREALVAQIREVVLKSREITNSGVFALSVGDTVFLLTAILAPAVEPRSSGEREAPQRYELSLNWSHDGEEAYPAAEANPLGEWVLWSDVEPLLRQREPNARKSDIELALVAGLQLAALYPTPSAERYEMIRKYVDTVRPAAREPDAPSVVSQKARAAWDQWDSAGATPEMAYAAGYRAALSREKP